jgi:ferrous iron transport protein B
LSTRIIESRPDRLTTILVTPLISCSARLPIYGLLIAAAFSQTPALWGFIDVGAMVMIGLYVMGLLLAFIVAAILRRGLIKGERAPLIMELPDYRWPRPRSLWLAVRSRVRIFVKEAGTVILALTVVLWALFTFPLPDKTVVTPTQNEVVEEVPFAHISSSQLERSYAGQLGHLIEPVIAPLGFNWKIGVGLVASFAAREVFISTFGVIYGLSEAGEAPSSLWKAMQADVHPQTGAPVYTPLVALSLLIFFAVALQCLSTVAVTRKETGSWRWPLFQVGYLNGLAWCLSFFVFQIGTKLGF